MDILRAIFVDPFAQMIAAPDLLAQTIWEGFVAGVLYSLIALGFVLIYKASGVFNFAQGIMMVFAALTLVGLHEKGVPAWAALALTVAVMYALALAIERLVLRPLVNQPDIILFMATFGVTYFLIGFGELVFGGNPKSMITKELYLPDGALDLHILGGKVELQKLDIAAAAIALTMVVSLASFFQRTRIGRALRAVADDHQAALSVGISLNQIWVIVWFTAGVVALATGIFWGARSEVSFALQVVALKALPVLILGGLTSVPGAIVGGLIIGIGEKLGEFYWGPLLGGGIESWLAYVIALAFLLVRPQGLFGERIIRADLGDSLRPAKRGEGGAKRRMRGGASDQTLAPPLTPALSPQAGRGGSQGPDHVLSRSRSVQDDLCGRHGDLPDPPGPLRNGAHPLRRLRRDPGVRQSVPHQQRDDPVPHPVAERHRAQPAHGIYRPLIARDRRIHGGRRLCLLQARDDISPGEYTRLDHRERACLGAGRRRVRPPQPADQGVLSGGGDAGGAVLSRMVLCARSLAREL